MGIGNPYSTNSANSYNVCPTIYSAADTRKRLMIMIAVMGYDIRIPSAAQSYPITLAENVKIKCWWGLPAAFRADGGTGEKISA